MKNFTKNPRILEEHGVRIFKTFIGNCIKEQHQKFWSSFFKSLQDSKGQVLGRFPQETESNFSRLGRELIKKGEP